MAGYLGTLRAPFMTVPIRGTLCPPYMTVSTSEDTFCTLSNGPTGRTLRAPCMSDLAGGTLRAPYMAGLPGGDAVLLVGYPEITKYTTKKRGSASLS